MTNSDRELMRDLISEAKEVTYREAIVTFVDILGFKALVDEKPAHVVAAAIERLQQSVQPAHTKTRGETTVRAIDSSRVHAFSDCVVRVRWIEGPDDLGPTFIRELADLATIQASLSQAGVFVMA